MFMCIRALYEHKQTSQQSKQAKKHINQEKCNKKTKIKNSIFNIVNFKIYVKLCMKILNNNNKKKTKQKLVKLLDETRTKQAYRVLFYSKSPKLIASN